MKVKGYGGGVFDPKLYWNGDSGSAVKTPETSRVLSATKTAKALRKAEAKAKKKSGRIEKRTKKKGSKSGVKSMTRKTIKSMEVMFSQLGVKDSD